MKQLMRSITTMLALLLALGGAWADWVKIGASDSGELFLDPETIRKEGHIRKVWQLQNLNQADDSGALSRRYRKEYDCTDKRDRILSFRKHSGSMATGKILDKGNLADPWQDIPPGSFSGTALNTVCAN